jgi:hypothetical protein
MKRYILDSTGEPAVEPDLLVWAAWYEQANVTIAKTEVGEAKVSTVFLGTDHSWGHGPLLLFETMTFGGKYDEYQWRYSTRAEAEAGHARVVHALEMDIAP